MIRTFFFLLFLPLMSYANIDAQIEAIQQASAQERFKLMNAFKQEVVEMQEEERLEALGKLKDMTQNPDAHLIIDRFESQTDKKIIEHLHNNNNSGTDIAKSQEEFSTPELIEEEAHEETENQASQESQSETENTIEQQVEEQAETEPENQAEHNIEIEREESVEREQQEEVEYERERDDDDDH